MRPLVLTAYDRYQVDDYVERLNEWAGGASTRAMDAERRVQEQAEDIRLLRERLTELEQRAVPAPDQALEQAAQRAAEAIAEGVKRADEIRRRAVADAEKQADDASRQAVATVQGLQEEREEILAELNRLRGAIQTLISGAGSQTGEAAPSGA